MSQHLLQRRLENLRSRAFRLLLVRGLSAIVASVVAWAIVLGLIDYSLRFRDRGVLVIFAATVLGIFAWTVWRLLGRLRRIRLGDTDLALQVEACFPQVKDSLASAVEFLEQSEEDVAAGSAAMRRAAIAETVARCETIDFNRTLNVRPAFRAALASLAVGLVAAALVVINPAAVRIALARLILPLGGVAWPQKTHLQLKHPVARIARGQALEVEVVDASAARLPSTCRVRYRFHDAEGKLKEEQEAMRPLGSAMIARRENVTRFLEFRVTGGDDQTMPWMPVEVLDPPSVVGLSIDVFPPAYTNWPHQVRDAASGLPILAGSRVELVGEASKPLRSAVLRIEGRRDIPARIESDGRKFHIGDPSRELPAGLVLEKPASYTIALIDSDGIRGGEERWQFRVQADATPSVAIEQPKSNLLVTPTARIDLRIDAHDDLGLRQVSLVYSSSGTTVFAESTLVLYEGPPRPALPNEARDETGERRTINHRLDLAELRLQPGANVTVYAAAADYRGPTSRSEPRILTIIAAEELQERMAARQGEVLKYLGRMLQLQRDARSRVRALEIRLHETAGLEAADVDRLQSAEFTEREIARGLADRSDGLPALVQGILAELEMNRVDSPDFARRMEGLLHECDRLQREQLAPIADELTAAIKGAQFRLQSSPRPAGRDVEDELHLSRAGGHQQAVIDSLENLLSQLRQWDDYRRFHRDLAQLYRDQEDVARATAELGRQTVGRDLKELLPQETAELKALAQRQFEFARRQDCMEQEMEQTIGILQPNEPLAAETLRDALTESRRLAIAATMHALGGKMLENGVGQSPADHQRILRDLQAVLDILANNRSQESQRLARGLGETAKELDGLRKRQAGLCKKLDELASASKATYGLNETQKAELQDVLRQQEELRQESLRVARQLEQLLADEAVSSLQKAAEKMELAIRDGAGGSIGSAGSHAQDAEKSLAEAVGKLRQNRRELKVREAVEQQARLEDAVKHLHRQEERIEAETREFAAQERSGPLSRGQVFGLLELARQQTLLCDEADRLARSLDAANAFRLGLAAAADEMRHAWRLLQDQQTGAATQQAEQAAIARLALLVGAFEAENIDNADLVRGGEQSASGNPNAARRPRGLSLLAEIKFLKLWQEDLIRRTQQADVDAARIPPEEMRRRYARLAEEQARLAEATLQFAKQQKTDADAGPQGDAP